MFTIGSSEGGDAGCLAMKLRWRAKAGTSWQRRTSNLVMDAGVQVVWERFCRYFDVETRYLPMEEGCHVITAPSSSSRPSTKTLYHLLGVVVILGRYLHRRTRTRRGDLRLDRQAGGRQ
nr:hypothetical protein [Mycobacterium lepromatosis]